ncbi:MAG TPA: arsenate reductase ArsC [Spirochaetota bacterium]|nr:arsenate reductase ArsC [Spirochaetota bacterium]HOM39174.1 arsenate reductase ArsC [Spirochaetota bacterium]HPQ50028.1 arsenate reductase ArsC [Spirochaetota bacterium]
MKKSVAFVCVGNSCRSQMAEGFAKKYGSDILEIYSAGTEPSFSVNPTAIEVMKEKGIDISDQYPKTLDKIPNKIDILITMGCGVVCPFIPNKLQEDWGLDDPVGKPIEFFREIRDKIEKKVIELVDRVKRGIV